MIMPRYPFTLLQLIRFRSSDKHGSEASSGTLLTENEIVHLSIQLCDVLSHIYNNRIVHRDVKLDNILMDIPYITLLPSLLSNNSYLTLLIISYVGLHESNVILGDFGEALDLRDTDVKDFQLPYLPGISKGGAQIAMSPEILSAQPGRGAILDYSMNDVYVLGRVMWDMMYPYDPLTSTELKSQSTENPTMSQYYSRKLRDMVLSLLSIDPKLRLTFNELSRLLRKLKNRKNGICIDCNHHHHDAPSSLTSAQVLSFLFLKGSLDSYLVGDCRRNDLYVINVVNHLAGLLIVVINVEYVMMLFVHHVSFLLPHLLTVLQRCYLLDVTFVTN
jgi:serine/threonine protein kinase